LQAVPSAQQRDGCGSRDDELPHLLHLLRKWFSAVHKAGTTSDPAPSHLVVLLVETHKKKGFHCFLQKREIKSTRHRKMQRQAFVGASCLVRILVVYSLRRAAAGCAGFIKAYRSFSIPNF
jgi:hypothetical protein